MSFSLLAAVLTLSSVLADKPAVAPQYNPAAPIASAPSSPVYSAQAVAAAPREDTPDTYGSPQAPVDGEQSSPLPLPLSTSDSIITDI